MSRRAFPVVLRHVTLCRFGDFSVSYNHASPITTSISLMPSSPRALGVDEVANTSAPDAKESMRTARRDFVMAGSFLSSWRSS